LTDCSPLTCARTPAPARARRGSLQLAYDEELERNERIRKLAEHNGYSAEVREFHGARWWFVPRDFVPMIGAMVARLPE